MPVLEPLSTNIILYCRNWQATVDFYRHTLALPVTFESDWFVEFRLAGNSHLSIADERRATIKSAAGAGVTLTLQVADAGAARNALIAAGVEAGPLKRHAWGAHVFYFYDPEGHRVELWSPLPA
jgi:catechol 2,3-dioxygenase-like lactoylglutathione lyase family enzyme